MSHGDTGHAQYRFDAMPDRRWRLAVDPDPPEVRTVTPLFEADHGAKIFRTTVGTQFWVESRWRAQGRAPTWASQSTKLGGWHHVASLSAACSTVRTPLRVSKPPVPYMTLPTSTVIVAPNFVFTP